MTPREQIIAKRLSIKGKRRKAAGDTTFPRQVLAAIEMRCSWRGTCCAPTR